MAQRLHVNVNSGRIGSGSALGEKNEKQYEFDKLEQRSAAKKNERGFSMYETDLQADGQVDPGAEGSANSAGR